MTSSLAGRVALVTGGARGIGRACCQRLADDGVQVAVNFNRAREMAAETVRMVEAVGVRGLAVRADVALETDVTAMVAEVEDQLGPIDLLVNNAGVFDFVSHAETTSDLWRRTLDVNLTGAFHVTWAVKSGMIERKYGRIVNVASIAALRSRPMSIAYAASKAGLVGFTKSLADALAEYQIRVNAVAPGLVETDILDGVAEETLATLVNSTPLRRIGQPEDIADVVAFLLSDQSRFMTGQTVVASGGRVHLP